jgi:hypothetical protein
VRWEKDREGDGACEWGYESVGNGRKDAYGVERARRTAAWERERRERRIDERDRNEAEEDEEGCWGDE